MERLAADKKAAAIAAARRRGIPKGSHACDACRDSEIEECEPRQIGGKPTILPCRVCQPTLYRDRAEGHYLPDHDVDTCDWPMCKQRADNAHRRRAMAAGWKQAPRPTAHQESLSDEWEF